MKIKPLVFLGAVAAVCVVSLGLLFSAMTKTPAGRTQMVGQVKHLLSMMSLHIMKHPELDARLPQKPGERAEFTEEFCLVVKEHTRNGGALISIINGDCMGHGYRLQQVMLSRDAADEVISEASFLEESTGKIIRVERPLGKLR